MYHELKCKQDYFQAVIDRRKPFEIRKNDRKFKTGDLVVLNEYVGTKSVPACVHYPACDCAAWKEIEKIREYGEDEALDICDGNRAKCGWYHEHTYTGRSCKVEIQEVFDLTAAGIEGYVAFTFKIIEVRQRKAYIEVEH